MFRWDPQLYGPVCSPLLQSDEPCPLGPGTPDMSRRADLAALDVRTLTADREIVDRDMAHGCIAGLWLRHGFLDESHAISQRISSPTGSYWHGILHRREEDFTNAKYWFRRVGPHPLFPALARAAREMLMRYPPGERSQFLTANAPWDPLALIDLCAAVRGRGDRDHEAQLCRQIAHVEWQLLFDYCYRRATGLAARDEPAP